MSESGGRVLMRKRVLGSSVVLRAYVNNRRMVVTLLPSEDENFRVVREDGGFLVYVSADVIAVAKKSDVMLYLSRSGNGGSIVIGDCRINLSSGVVDVFRGFEGADVSGAEFVVRAGSGLGLRVVLQGGKVLDFVFNGSEEELMAFCLLKYFMDNRWCDCELTSDGWGRVLCRLRDFFGNDMVFKVMFEVTSRSPLSVSGIYVDSNVVEVASRVEEEGEDVWGEVYDALQKAYWKFEELGKKLEECSGGYGSVYVDALLAR